MSVLVSGPALGAWRRIRRYAVPAPMIAAATAAREAGDPAAACEAAGMLIGATRAELSPFADDVRHLAPDLLRWHLPRTPGRGDTTIAPRHAVVLARTGDAVLAVATPRLGLGTQRLTLLVADELDGDYFHTETDWTDARHLWDARAAATLVERTCSPQTAALLAAQDTGDYAAAWALAGVELEPLPSDRQWAVQRLEQNLRTLDVDPVVIVAAARATGRATVSVGVSYQYDLDLTALDTPHPRGRFVSTYTDRAEPPQKLAVEPFTRPVDLHLVRFGWLAPDELHPLVGPLLAPFAADRAGAARGGGDVRVRCGGEWHVVRWESGRLATPHGDDERRRELTLRALGGELQGCFAAEQGWREPRLRLPRRLRDQRRDLIDRALHGDLPAVLAALDAGVDPRVRDPHGRGLLHLLPHLDDGGERAVELLHRLLAAGLNVDDSDHRGQTPLIAAVHGDGSPRLVQALLAAGANPRAEDNVGDGVAEAFRRHREEDLPFLADVLA